MSGKVALVLSAGGMFGAYQAGAWKVLAGAIRPEIVVGASIGALNAWAIAGGVGPEDLIRNWLDPSGTGLARFSFTRPPWLGFFDPDPLHRRIQELWQAFRPRVDVGIVAVELRPLRPRLFSNDQITWRHLAASCAVLLCYPQVRLGGSLYTDGGLLSSLPLWAAAAMGAERIIAVNALPEAPSRVVGVAVRGFRAVAPQRPQAPANLEIDVIVPSRRLGTLREAVFWNAKAIPRFIEQGEADAGKLSTQNRKFLKPAK